LTVLKLGDIIKIILSLFYKGLWHLPLLQRILLFDV